MTCAKRQARADQQKAATGGRAGGGATTGRGFMGQSQPGAGSCGNCIGKDNGGWGSVVLRTVFVNEVLRMSHRGALSSNLESRGTVAAGLAGCLLLTTAVLWAALPALAADRTTKKSAARTVAPQPRTWTDLSGRYKTRATLVEVVDGKVRLRKLDGTVVTVPIEKLSETDQAWLEKHASGAPATPTGPASTAESAASGEWPGWLGPNRPIPVY